MATVGTRADLASVASRFIALLIDGFVLSLITWALFGVIRGPGGAVGVLIAVTYQWYFLTRNSGQTPGKMLMGIRVVKADGSKITDADAVLRYFGYVLNSVLLMLGWLWVLIDPKRQGLHDKLVNTYVVNT